MAETTTVEQLALPRRRAQAAVLVWAVEDQDRDGRLLPLDARRRATRDALDEPGDDWPGRRAEALVPLISEHMPQAARLLAWSDPVIGWALPVLLVAAVVGVASNALGPSRHLNVLALPLLGLILWNVAMLALLLVRGLLPRPPLATAMATSSGNRPRILAWLEARARGWQRQAAGADEDSLEQRVSESFVERWLRFAAPIAMARLRRLLHAAAALMVAGTVAGMYWRGILFEYRATWESTFLDAAAVDRLLAVMLAPAAAVLRIDVLSVTAIAWPDSGPAALWIHLWAVTALLVVILPRLLLVAFESARLARLDRRLTIELPKAYLRRLRAAVDSSEHLVQVLPFSYRPTERAMRHLRGLLLDIAGARARIRTVMIDYGGEPPMAAAEAFEVVIFTLAQTPELEVHGELLQALRRRAEAGGRLLALVDEGPYRQRMGDGAGSRLDERRRAWRRVALHADVPLAVVDLDQPPADAVLQALSGAIWPEAA